MRSSNARHIVGHIIEKISYNKYWSPITKNLGGGMWKSIYTNEKNLVIRQVSITPIIILAMGTEPMGVKFYENT
jgi:hypothetical protein